MSSEEIIKDYLKGVAQTLVDGDKGGLTSDSFSVVVESGKVKLLGPSHFKYLVLGRGPGKMPPVERIESWVKKYNIQGRDKLGRFITDRSLAWAVAKKIAGEGTDVYQGKRQGVDFLGAVDKDFAKLLDDVAYNEALKISTVLFSNLNKGTANALRA